MAIVTKTGIIKIRTTVILLAVVITLMSADNCRAIDSLAPASSPFGLPVYVAGRQLGPFCENANSSSVPNKAGLQLIRRYLRAVDGISNEAIYAAAAAACRPSANSSIIFLLNAGTSSGLRLETSRLSFPAFWDSGFRGIPPSAS
jgi:hypothetical protein